MADTFTALLRLVLQETGGNQNVWGDINNSSAIDLLEDAIAGREDVDVTLSDQMLMPENGADDPARAAILICSGSPGTDREVTVPSTSKIYVVTNETSPAFNVTIKTALGAGTVITPGTRSVVFVDSAADDVIPVSGPQATETVQGIAEIADQAEVDAGTDDERFVTPLKLATFPAVNQATEDVKGIAEIADQAETDLGADDERFITPLKFETSEQLEQATTGQLGRVIKATQGEVDTGTDPDKYVTPATLAGGAFTGLFAGCVVTRDADHNSGHTTGLLSMSDEVAIPFTQESIDTGLAQFGTEFHSTSSNNTRITIPAGVNVVWLSGSVSWDQFHQNSSGMWHMRIRKNASVTVTIDPAMGLYIPHLTQTFFGGFAGTPDSNVGGQIVTVPINVNENDFFELTTMSQGSDFGDLIIQGGTAVFMLTVLG
jgi:hypothetical protein